MCPTRFPLEAYPPLQAALCDEAALVFNGPVQSNYQAQMDASMPRRGLRRTARRRPISYVTSFGKLTSACPAAKRTMRPRSLRSALCASSCARSRGWRECSIRLDRSSLLDATADGSAVCSSRPMGSRSKRRAPPSAFLPTRENIRTLLLCRTQHLQGAPMMLASARDL